MKKPKPVKPRNVWQINPKSRVEKNDKAYSRPKEKKKLTKLKSKVNWFGEE